MDTCPNCGHENGEDSAHCTKCGTRLLSSCNMCGSRLKPDNTHCPDCGTEVVLGEVNLLRITGTGIGGEFGNETCAIGLSDKRIFIVSNKNGITQYNSALLNDVCKLKFKTSIVHATKGSYAVNFMIASRKAKYRFASNEGRKFAKALTRAQKANRKTSKTKRVVRVSHVVKESPRIDHGSEAPKSDLDELTPALGLACLVVPLLGVIIWLGERGKHPKKAKNALLIGIISLIVMAIGPCRSGSRNQRTNSEQVNGGTDGVSYIYAVIEEDIYDIPIKTQVERNIVVTGEISHEQMDELLMAQYEEAIASTGYEYREHPDAIYIYFYAPGSSGIDWIGRIEKHAASNSPGIYNRIPEGETIHTSSYSSTEQVVVDQDIGNNTNEVQETVSPSDETISNRFEKTGEIITDSSAGLQWRLGPDTNTSFNEAVDWVNSLDGDWRMPTINELSALYQAGIVNDDEGLIWCDVFSNTGCWVWSSDRSDNTSAKIVYFWGGDVMDYSTTSNRDSNIDGRVFAVR